MLILISPAKTMSSTLSLEIDATKYSEPRFNQHTQHIASLMTSYSIEEIEEIFRISRPLAIQLHSRFKLFFDELSPSLPAVDSYDGVVYKHFKECLTNKNIEYLQKHLRISSLIYGLLKPLDLIKPYRMEGFVRLAGTDTRVDRYWRDIQTQTLIDDTKKMGSTLLYLASKEEQNSFNWREVKKAIQVIDIEFLQYNKDGKLRQVVIYTKMARGEMINYMTTNNITELEELKKFEWGGYRYNDIHSTQNKLTWIME